MTTYIIPISQNADQLKRQNYLRISGKLIGKTIRKVYPATYLIENDLEKSVFDFKFMDKPYKVSSVDMDGAIIEESKSLNFYSLFFPSVKHRVRYPYLDGWEEV